MHEPHRRSSCISHFSSCWGSLRSAMQLSYIVGALHYRCALPGFIETEGHPALVKNPLFALPPPTLAFSRLLSDNESATEFLSHRLLRGSGGSSGVSSTSAAWDQSDFDTGTFCNPLIDMCADGTRCSYFDQNPNGGVLSFDSVPSACIAVFQSITFDSWTDTMYAVMDSVSPLAFAYFILIAILGGVPQRRQNRWGCGCGADCVQT